MLCFVPAPDGRPHVAHRMVRTFEVGEGGGADLPKPDAVITATDEGFEIPDLRAGEQTIELRNAASAAREFYLYSPNPGVSLAQVEAWGEGGDAVDPGGHVGLLTVDLEAGRPYVLYDEELSEAPFGVS